MPQSACVTDKADKGTGFCIVENVFLPIQQANNSWNPILWPDDVLVVCVLRDVPGCLFLRIWGNDLLFFEPLLGKTEWFFNPTSQCYTAGNTCLLNLKPEFRIKIADEQKPLKGCRRES